MIQTIFGDATGLDNGDLDEILVAVNEDRP